MDHPRQGVDQFSIVEGQATRGDEVRRALDHREHGGRRHLGVMIVTVHRVQPLDQRLGDGGEAFGFRAGPARDW